MSWLVKSMTECQLLKPESYERWLGVEPDPHNLLITYPSEPMTIWPISTRVNKPENDDPSILERATEPVGLASSSGSAAHMG